MQGAATRFDWGLTPISHTQGEREVSLYRLSVDSLSIEVCTYGASLFSVETPDRDGIVANVVLGLPDLAATLDHYRNHYLGCTVGRYANRIKGASFPLDGKRVSLKANHGPHQLHGGAATLGRQVWDAKARSGNGWAELELTIVSPDGEAGFPGELTVTTNYRIEPGLLAMTHEAVTTAPTPVSLTNHAYWNLAGTGSVRGHQLQILADRMVHTDDEGIPTGDLHDLTGTPYDMRQARSLASTIGELGSLDMSYVVGNPPNLGSAAVLSDQSSGRRMEVVTDQPSIQAYVGNDIGRDFAPYGAVCLETQQFTDAPNQPSFPSTILRPGELFVSRTEHRFSIDQ